MMYSEFIKENAIPTKRLIHDCVDTGTPLVLSSGIEIPFPCDCASRNYISGYPLYIDSISTIKDAIDNSEIRVKLKMTLNGAANDICVVRVVVPHPTFGDILIDEQDIVLYKNNIDTHITRFFLLYNGIDSNAKQYGFKFTLIPDSNMTLKARSILVTI